MKRLRAFGRGCGRFAKSLVWDSATGTVSSGRVNLFVTLSIAILIVYKLIGWIDAHFAKRGELPVGSLEVMAGIATVLFGGGVGGYMMNRFASRSYDTPILPEVSASVQDSGAKKTEGAENY